MLDLKVGDLVSYRDVANPRSFGRIVAIHDNPWSTFEIDWVSGVREGDHSFSDCRQYGWTSGEDAERLFEINQAGRARNGLDEPRSTGCEV